MPKRHLISDSDDDEVLVPAKRRNIGSRHCQPLSVEPGSSSGRNLNDDRTETAPVYVPADELLERVLVHIEHDTNRGYEAFLKKHGKLHVKQTLLNSVRSSAMAETSSDRWSLDKLWRIGGDLSSLESAVYMDVVRRKQISAGDDDFFRLYIGQADKLKSRINEHERKMHLEKTLHHRVANDSRHKRRFVVLLELPPAIEDLDKWLNVAEMWKAVEYQTLPRSTLSNPLNQNHGQWAKREVWKLKESTDPLVREHYEQVVLPAAQANRKLGRAKMRQEKFVPLINALREKGKDRELKRGPETEDERHVRIRCSACKSKESERMDPAPLYEISTGHYVVRGQACPTCPAPKWRPNRNRQRPFKPVDKNIKTVEARQVARHDASARKKTAKKTGNDAKNVGMDEQQDGVDEMRHLSEDEMDESMQAAFMDAFEG
ncbi:hypothetical protein KC318_g5402 [Hortaea werneckii]|uniref:Uncharacterized protein n=1 Tax=Hortaea werneckii TaxID=91943 RepID=A0A3M6ZYL3_HORWE|nr:hypothetical protein KC334_g4297 [Hortaea werneckii]KAI7011856.1 hypothetical protein KC355_g5634 [Hortaea werneckii]KAI7668227.1 hypothetical protein KC318_g5402 [Hortaea werneckii]RMY20396.1 hypothetical protein D0867_04035 [Hortaea werneckii]RMY35002.1 hypothetical protein D0866_04897 [Hortaea werneckii]